LIVSRQGIFLEELDVETRSDRIGLFGPICVDEGDVQVEGDTRIGAFLLGGDLKDLDRFRVTLSEAEDRSFRVEQNGFRSGQFDGSVDVLQGFFGPFGFLGEEIGQVVHSDDIVRTQFDNAPERIDGLPRFALPDPKVGQRKQELRVGLGRGFQLCEDFFGARHEAVARIACFEQIREHHGRLVGWILFRSLD